MQLTWKSMRDLGDDVHVYDLDNDPHSQFIIVLDERGFHFTAQCGGMQCTHPVARGLIRTVSEPLVNEEIFHKDICFVCKDFPPSEKLIDVIDRELLAASLPWRVDRDSLDVLQEGWIPIQANGIRAILVTENCD